MKKAINKTLYYALTELFFVIMFLVCGAMCFLSYRGSGKLLESLFCFLIFAGVFILFAPCILVHECGHLFFGMCAHMKPVSLRVGWLLFEGKKVRFAFSPVAGETQFLPIGEKNVRRRIIATSLGGAVFNFIYGIVFLILFFALPYHPALLFFELFAPLHLFEGFCAMLPAELNAGRTDGEFVRLLQNNAPEAQVVIAVLTVQGILFHETFDGVDEGILFGLPVVREDDPAFLSLLHLRWQYLMWKGETERAGKELFRLEELSGYLDESAAAQVACDAAFMRRITDGRDDVSFVPPAAAKGTCSMLRAELAAGRGDREEYKKIAASEPATGIRALESTFFERFIQNF